MVGKTTGLPVGIPEQLAGKQAKELERMSVEILNVLDNLESELKALGCWSGMPPSPEAMASEVPFCMDTMPFTQWLQWFYIPRVKALLEAGADLPKGSNIKPYAEEALMVEKVASERILVLIERCDALMS